MTWSLLHAPLPLSGSLILLLLFFKKKKFYKSMIRTSHYICFLPCLLCPQSMTEPQPSYSAYREASFGHAVLDIKNRTHAYYAWHRNDDGVAAVADSTWFYNREYLPLDESA